MANPFQSMSRGISNLLARAVVRGLNTATKCQMLQIEMAGGEGKSDIEHMEPYGFTAVPIPGAEAVAAYFDGDRSHGVVLVVSDRRYRIKGLASGEVAVYTDEGDSIILKRGNSAEVNTRHLIVNATEKATFNTPLLEVPDGEIRDKTSTMTAMRDVFDAHNHKENGDGGGTTDAPAQKMGAS
ncbi:phage baseplate assembly protein V [Erwinia sp. P7711]|uniref:phage baseplate assembly protein V n=1 Tax=Erwinia sp. P7711 TaxID=3141451 RepID=UPI003199C43A